MGNTTSNKGFTLIELLVVIAIIALLLTIMMPALSKAKQQTLGVVCKSNLKQMTVGVMMYIDSNEGRLPRAGSWVSRVYYPFVVTSDTPWWYESLANYLDIDLAKGDYSALGCPAVKKKYDHQADFQTLFYSMNIILQDRKLELITSRGLGKKTPIFYEAVGFIDEKTYETPYFGGPATNKIGGWPVCVAWSLDWDTRCWMPNLHRRGGKMGNHWLFADMHVAWHEERYQHDFNNNIGGYYFGPAQKDKEFSDAWAAYGKIRDVTTSDGRIESLTSVW